MSTKWIPRGPSCVTHAQLNPSSEGFRNVGRGVVSGRISAIALSPDGTTIYAGAASGGVWRSHDDGAHWEPLMDEQPTLAVGALAVASDGTVYVGTGEFNDVNSASGVMTGVGILRSSSSGWQLMPPPDPAGDDLVRSRIARIVVHPTRPNEIYAATTRGLFIATDRVAPGQKSFHVFPSGDPTYPECTDVAVDFSDPDAPIVYAAFIKVGIKKVTGAPLDVTRAIEDRFPFGAPIPTTAFDRPIDLGFTWRISLAIATVRTNILYAVFTEDEDIIGLFRTDTAGTKWTDFGTATFGQQGSAEFMSLLAVDPRDPETVFFGDTRLWRRRQGHPWRIESGKSGDNPGVHDDQHAIAFHPTDPAIVWLGNDGGLWKSIDGGEHFVSRNRGLATAQVYSISGIPGEPSVLFAGTQDLGAISTRGHAAWREVAGGDGFYTAIEPKRPRFWYFGYDPGRDPILRYSAADADLTAWKQIKAGLPEEPMFAQPYPFIADPHVEGRLYLGVDILYWWPDKDASKWLPIDTTDDGTTVAISAIAAAPNDGEVVYYARTSGHVHRIRRTGDTWGKPVTSTAIPAPPANANDRCQQIAVDPTNANHFFVALGSWSGPDITDAPVAHRIWEGTYDPSTNAITLLPFTDLPGVAIGPVTVSADLDHINALVLDAAAPGVMFAGTDHGVYRFDPALASWQRFSDGLPQALVVTSMELDASSHRLRVSSMGRGVWECLLDAPERAVDLYVRDHMLDDGTRATVASRQNPVTLDVLHWTDSPDIKVDTETMLIGGFESLSTVGYDGSGGVDYLGFESLDGDRPRGGAASRVYVQVHNRGPEIAHEVNVRLFWAKKDGDNFPDLPLDFWAHHLDDTFDTTHWKPLGAAQKIIELVPGTPRVARFDWAASGSNDTIGILAVVSSPQDPLPTLPLTVEDAVQSGKHVALRETVVNPATYKIVLEVLAIVGLVVVAVVEAPKLL